MKLQNVDAAAVAAASVARDIPVSLFPVVTVQMNGENTGSVFFFANAL